MTARNNAARSDRRRVHLGGGLLLALNLVLFAKAGALGISEGLAVRIDLASAGVWWAVFTLIPLSCLRDRPPGRVGGATNTFRAFAATLSEMRRYPQTLRFLLAYLIYNDAVQTVITLAAQFGNDELKLPMADLTMVILMVQFVAFFGNISVSMAGEMDGREVRGDVQPGDLDGRAGGDVCVGA